MRACKGDAKRDWNSSERSDLRTPGMIAVKLGCGMISDGGGDGACLVFVDVGVEAERCVTYSVEANEEAGSLA